MPTDYESLAKMFLNTPQGGKIIKGLDKVNATISTESGKQFLTLLAGGGGDALKNAAQAAMQSDRDQARILLSSLLSTRDGAAMAAKMIELFGA